MKKLRLIKKLKESPEDEFDDRIKKCVICNKKGIIKYDHKSLCAKHYIEIEDEECIKSQLYCKISIPLEIQKEIRKQKPDFYKQIKNLLR